ncbi:MAG: hypothetical protein RLZZ181_425 [Pseudomonadota bacterium]|jgi:hypothetical protein
MATTRKNPGNPFKVAGRMMKTAVSKVKTAAKNTQKAPTKKTSTTSSTRRTTSTSGTAYTGKSQVNKKLLDQALTKNLPGVTVTRKKQPVKKENTKPLVVRTINAKKGGRSIAQMEKMNAMDSTTYMNALPASDRSYMLNQMKGYQRKDPSVRFSNFKYDPKTETTLYTRTYKKGKKQ